MHIPPVSSDQQGSDGGSFHLFLPVPLKGLNDRAYDYGLVIYVVMELRGTFEQAIALINSLKVYHNGYHCMIRVLDWFQVCFIPVTPLIRFWLARARSILDLFSFDFLQV